MNPKNKSMWVDALRSGEYKQTQSSLKDDTGFCCLGVLCDLYTKSENPEGSQWFKETEDSPTVFRYTCGGDSEWYEEGSFLPHFVAQWAGLRSSAPQVNAIDSESSETPVYLHKLNDTGSSFSEIADVIEKSL